MIIKIPNLYQGKEVSGLVELVDIPPTILALLGLEDSMEHSGQNLIKVIEEKVSKESVYAETSIQKQQMLESIEKGYTIKKISDLPPQILEGLASLKTFSLVCLRTHENILLHLRILQSNFSLAFPADCLHSLHFHHVF